MSNAKLQPFLNTLRHYRQLPVEQARGLPAEFYTSEDFLHYETEQLFRKEWLCLGRADAVAQPGDYFTLDLLGEPLLVVRSDDDNIRVFANVCRHRNMPVAQGAGNTQSFTCPYHAWSYATDGHLLRTPRMTLADAELVRCRLPELRSTQWRGFLFVSFDDDAQPLAPRLSGLDPILENYQTHEMQHVMTREETWQCNWKCLLENFMEGYHLSVVHHTPLHPITPTRLCEKFAGGPGFTGYRSYYLDIVPEREPYSPALSEKERRCSTLFCIYPGLVVSQSPNFLAYMSLQPDGPDQVRVRWGTAIYDKAAVPQSKIDRFVDFWNAINSEDHAQLIRLQQGLKSRYGSSGPLAPADLEGTLWDFYQYLAGHVPEPLQAAAAD
jgi:phenylpropionate dioxygenase-like ring-hydroxylating dioxygenase large terminal subunit